MKVLVACEYSGRVRDAFIKRGHDAISCDLLPTVAPGPHYQGDVRNLLSEQWDMMIAFPPCTHLSIAGNRFWAEKRADGRQQEALAFVSLLMGALIDRIAIENPVGRISSAIRKPDQIIDPYQFGDPWKKKTCLWLKNLPKLTPVNQVDPIGHWVSSGSRYHASATKSFGDRKRPEMAGKRNLTFQGIADAMACQWGSQHERLDIISRAA